MPPDDNIVAAASSSSNELGASVLSTTDGNCGAPSDGKSLVRRGNIVVATASFDDAGSATSSPDCGCDCGCGGAASGVDAGGDCRRAVNNPGNLLS